MKKTKSSLAILLTFAIIASLFIPISAASEYQTMFWPSIDYDTRETVFTELPCLVELKVGENTDLPIEDATYSLTVSESGFYVVSGIGLFEIASEVEGNFVKKCGFNNWFNEDKGEVGYFNAGETYYFRIYKNLMTSSATVKYLGELVSAVPEREYAYKNHFTVWNDGPYKGALSDYPMNLTFSHGETYRFSMWQGTMDGVGLGTHHFTTALCGCPIEFDVTMIDYADSVAEVILPEDFNATALVRYMGDYGLYYLFAELPESIEVKFKDGSSYTAHIKDIRNAWEAKGSESFIIADGSIHSIYAGYASDEDDNVYFYVSLDGTEILKKEAPVVVSSAAIDIISLCRRIGYEFNTLLTSTAEGTAYIKAIITALKNMLDYVGSFFDSRAYAIKHGYSFVPVSDIKLLLGE